MNQNDRLLRHLRAFGTIQPMTAWSQLGIYRLASRICDLRKAGHNIEKRMVTLTNRWGEDVRVAEYKLIDSNLAEQRARQREYFAKALMNDQLNSAMYALKKAMNDAA